MIKEYAFSELVRSWSFDNKRHIDSCWTLFNINHQQSTQSVMTQLTISVMAKLRPRLLISKAAKAILIFIRKCPFLLLFFIHGFCISGLSSLGLSNPVFVLVPHFMLIRVNLPLFQKWAKTQFLLDPIMAIELRSLHGVFIFVPKDFVIYLGRDILRSVGASLFKLLVLKS